MTSLELLSLEKNNLDEIRLYSEGLFWKAFERSAFILCSQQSKLKPTRKSFKSLNGGTIISVGFPSASEGKFISGLEVIIRDENRLVLKAKNAVSEEEFEKWKVSCPVWKASTPILKGDGKSNVSEIERRIKSFNIASSTPLQCMAFLSEIQSLII